jgi:A118 family predicted phage portal protein
MKILKDLKEKLHAKGVDIIDTDYYDIIDMWQSWYNGNVDDFHYYNVKIADGSTAQFERKTMSMAKKGAEDMMKLLWSNKCDIKLSTDEKTKKLWDVLDSKQNNFTIMFPQMIELAMALGTTAMTQYKDTLGKTRIEYINDAKEIIPYAFDNFNITGFIVFNQWQEVEKRSKFYYTHLTYHEFKNEKDKENGEYKRVYRKYNEVYKSKNPDELGKEIPFEEVFPDVEELVEVVVDTPHFQIIKPPLANNVDIKTPMGLSIFGNSIDKLKAIDNKYDSFDMEFVDGKRRILVDRTALKSTPQVDSEGNISQQLYFDRNDRTYVAMNGMKDQPVKDISFDLRYKEHIDSINAELNWYSASLGFGENFYKFDGGGQATATEILSQDDDAFRTKQTFEVVIKDVIIDLVKSVCYLEGIELSENEIQVEFDYSRFENQEKTQLRLEREVSQGITSKIEYRMKVYGETEEIAKQKIDEIKKNEPNVKDLLGTNNEE